MSITTANQVRAAALKAARAKDSELKRRRALAALEALEASGASKAERPDLKMHDPNVGQSVGSMIVCASCGARRGMAEAQGAVGRGKLPQTCRGRHPHLSAFDKECDARPALIMMGASNLWFPSTADGSTSEKCVVQHLLPQRSEAGYRWKAWRQARCRRSWQVRESMEVNRSSRGEWCSATVICPDD